MRTEKVLLIACRDGIFEMMSSKLRFEGQVGAVTLEARRDNPGRISKCKGNEELGNWRNTEGGLWAWRVISRRKGLAVLTS